MNITLSQETQNLLHLAQKEGKKPIDTILAEALMNYIEDLADCKSALEAEKRLQNQTSFISLNELAKKADIDTSKI